MKHKRFTEKQIISIWKEREAGMKVAELGRKHGVSEQTIYRWQSKYGGLEVSEVRRLRLLEEEKWTRKFGQVNKWINGLQSGNICPITWRLPCQEDQDEITHRNSKPRWL